MTGPVELRVIAGPDAGLSVPLDGEVVLGRDTTLTHPLADLEVSRHHARFALRDGQLHVEDLGSTNGTFLNDSPLTGPQPLHDGDRIRIGDSEFQYLQ